MAEVVFHKGLRRPNGGQQLGMLPGVARRLEVRVMLGGGLAAVGEVEVLSAPLVQPLLYGPEAALALAGGLAEEELIVDAGIAVL